MSHLQRGLVAASIATFMVLTSTSAAPIGPVVNGDFELALPGKAQSCEVFGDTALNVLPPDQRPDPIQDPTDPDNEIVVPWYWLVSVSPCEAGALKAAHWSSSRVSQWADHDGDGDREVLIDGSVTLPPNDAIGRNHNFWQAYPSPHQAYSGNFGSLSFRVEAGTVPSSARVILSLSNTPLGSPSPWVGPFLMCDLTLTPGAPAGDGTVSMDPLTGSFRSRDPSCVDMKAAWDAGDADAKRGVLAQTRIVQLSFWNFNTTTATVRLDDVSINDSRFVVEELAP